MSKTLADKELHQHVIAFFDIVHSISSIVGLIEAAIKSEIPSSLYYLIDEIKSKIEFDIPLILKEDYRMNYYEASQIYSSDFKKLNVGKEYCIIFFPVIFKEDVLHTCVFAHELGHFLMKRKNFLDDLWKDQKISSIINERLETFLAEVKQSSKALNVQALDKMRKSIIDFQEKTGIIVNWLNELLADSIGSLLIGIPYFCSLTIAKYELSSKNDFNKSHPPIWLRINWIYQQCIDVMKNSILENRISDIYNPFIESTLNLAREEEDTRKGTPGDIENRLFLLCTNILEELMSPVCEKLNNEFSKLKKELDENQIIKLIEEIKRGIPPAEYFVKTKECCEHVFCEPADFLSILNASWLYVLNNSINFNENNQNLISKSFEASYIKKKFQELCTDDII